MTSAEELAIHYPVSPQAAKEAIKKAKGNMSIADFVIKVYLATGGDWDISSTAKKLITLAEEYNKG